MATRTLKSPSEGKNVTRGTRDALMSAASLVILIGVLAMVDDRVRDRFTPEGVWDRVTTERGQLSMAGTKAYSVIADHGRLAMFVVAGSVLVACMLRT
jgi:hypothetical protein